MTRTFMGYIDLQKNKKNNPLIIMTFRCDFWETTRLQEKKRETLVQGMFENSLTLDTLQIFG